MKRSGIAVPVILFTIILVSLMGCKDEPGLLTGLKDRTFEYSYIDTTSYKYLKLETCPESLIGSVGEVLFDTNRVMVFDEMTKAIVVFDSTGKYLAKVSSVGRGPGEYFQGIRTFDLDRQRKQIIIYDFGAKKILKYSYKGDFVQETKLIDYRGTVFAYLGDDKYAFWMHNYSKQQVMLTDSIGSIILQFHIKPEKYSVLNKAMDSFFSKNSDNSPYYIPIWEDKIYRISKDGIELIIDFRSKEEMISTKDEIEKVKKFLPTNKYAYLNNLTVSGGGKYFVQTFHYGEVKSDQNLGSPLEIVGDFNAGILSAGKKLYEPYDYMLDCFRKYGAGMNYPTGVYGDYFYSFTSDPDLDPALYGKDESNPWLFFYKIKIPSDR